MLQQQTSANIMQKGQVESVETETPTTSQGQALNATQVQNSAGGFVWQVDDMTRFRRFLVLGSETATFYIGEKKLGEENAAALRRLVENGRGEEVVRLIELYSVEGRVAKQDPIIFALAFCARNKDRQTKKLAYEVLNKVCRIPTHLFAFVEFCQSLSNPGTGWGRAHRNAISKWYTQKRAMKLALAVTKYKQREGWSHKDLLRLAHPKADDPCVACVLKYVSKGIEAAMTEYFKEDMSDEINEILFFLKAIEDVKLMTDPSHVVKYITENGLVREHIPTPMLTKVEVWEALLLKMPMTAMIRNLGKMTQIGVLQPQNTHTVGVCVRLNDEESLKKARIHPFNVLVALKQYSKGKGDKGKLQWAPVPEIKHALNSAFYKAFKFVEPTNKRFLLAIDVSGSMTCGGCNGCTTVTPRLASAAMAMVTARTEQNHTFVGFSHKLVPLKIKASMKLENVIRVIEEVPMGDTDCAQPMLYAQRNKLEVDVFIVYTDCETWAGAIHPSEALKRYRESSGIHDAKLIVCAMTSNGFTLANPEDPGMFDMAGFDSAAPQVIQSFVKGEL